MNFSEHFLHLLQLLRVEREEDRKQYENKIRYRSLEDRKKEGVTWYPVVVGKSYLSTGEKWTLQLEKTTDLRSRHFFQSGASVSVFLDDKGKLSASGIISRVDDQSMTVVLNREDPPDWLDEGRLGVDLLFDESTYDEMERTLKKLVQVKEGRIAELIGILCGDVAPRFETPHQIKHPSLNDSQNRALALISAAKDIGLVHGPPGTGKTTTLVEAIKNTVATEKQVLVSASSNAAVDLLAERLTKQGIRVLRIGHPARVTEEVVASTLDARLANHPSAKMLRDLRKKSEEMRAFGKKYKRHFGREERQQRRLLMEEARSLKEEALALENYMIHDELNKAEVIACTLVGANSQHVFNRSFKTLFIDEASQALEPASWIPVMKADRVIMAGDHWQLPPTVKSVEAGKKGLSETLFERCIAKYQADVMLETQYRMHPAIMAFSNREFYKGKLKTAAAVEQRESIFGEPVQYIDTAGCGFEEKLNLETLSTYNEEEAHFLLQQLDRLFDEHGEAARRMTIGIIAPYKAQVEVLRTHAGSYEWFLQAEDRISINTVDAFQGQERDMMLISLVRSNPDGEIGFLGDVRRMNVAMTRAKYLLMMIGDSATLSNNDFYDRLIRDFQVRNYYHSAFEYMYG